MNFLNFFASKSVNLFEQYKNTKNYLIIFSILQLYLIENNFRTIAQIDFYKSSKNQIAKCFLFLDE